MSRPANWLLRFSIALAFLYPPIDALGDPEEWFGYFPVFVQNAAHSIGIPDLVLLHGFGLVEVAIALWILLGKKVHIPATAALVILVLIVALDANQFSILFRDISIALAAGALAFDSWRKDFGSNTASAI